MTSTEGSRNVITDASKSLKDELLHGLRDADRTNTNYASYTNYQMKKERLEFKRNNDIPSSMPLFAN